MGFEAGATHTFSSSSCCVRHNKFTGNDYIIIYYMAIVRPNDDKMSKMQTDRCCNVVGDCIGSAMVSDNE